MKKGVRPNLEIKKKIVYLFDVEGLTFPQIADKLGLGSRQLARYHYKYLVDKVIDKEKTKD